MFRSLILLLSLTLLMPTVEAAVQPSRDGGITAMRTLPRRYQSGIIRVSGDRARVNPSSWSLLARPIHGGGLTSFRVARGQIISERASINPRNLVRSDSPITISQVRVDSGEAWSRAERFYANRGQRIGSASFVLRQRGANAAPIWSISGYLPSGRYVGAVTLLATTGAILSAN